MLDSGGQTDVIYLDFTKAFDSVPHHLLIHTFQTFGFNGTLLNWFHSHLNNRYQRVLIHGSMSTKLPVRSGVPQGSILGPLMFILYVNDIADNIPNLSFKTLYADDAKIGSEIKSMQNWVDLQSDLNIFTRWSDIWKFFFNGTKCKVLTIARSFKHNFLYHLDNIHLESVKEFNDLGLLINSSLTWRSDIATKISKANRILGLIKRAVDSMLHIESNYTYILLWLNLYFLMHQLFIRVARQITTRLNVYNVKPRNIFLMITCRITQP